MAGNISIIVPEAGTNLVYNPAPHSLVGAIAYWAAHNTCTVTCDTTYARFGNYCYKIVPDSTNDGVNLTTATLANAIHYVSFYARGNAASTLQVSLNAGVNYNAAAIIGGATGGWVRYGVQIPAAQATGSQNCIIRNTANETYYLAGVQVEQQEYYTTYIDGDRGPLYRWAGLRGGSTSTRSAQDRSGGRERNLDDYGVRVRQLPGAGYPPVVNNTQPMTLQPGAVFQNVKTLPRKLTLELDLHHTTLAGLHGRRQDLIDLIKPDAVRGAQAFILSYAGANSARKVYAAFRYASGLGLGRITGGGNWVEDGGNAPVDLLAVDPYWYEDDQATATISFTQNVANFAYTGARLNGEWQALGSGMSGPVYTIAVDRQRNRVWFAGKFATANGVTVNSICYWNGTTFVATNLAGASRGVTVTSIGITDIAIAPNGDVWLVGDITAAGGAATVGIVQWVNATDSFNVFNLAVASGTTWFSVAISDAGATMGRVYVAGDITDWNGTAASDYVAQYDGAAWSALGTSPFTATSHIAFGHALKCDCNGYLIAGDYNTAAGSALRRWNGTAWASLGVTNAANKWISSILVAPDNTIYAGGNYASIGGVTAANIAAYTGAAFVALGAGTDNEVTTLARTDSGILIAGGSFTSAGGLAVPRYALWNGTTWAVPDMTPPGAPTMRPTANGEDIYVGLSTTGTATSADPTAVTNGGTAFAFPAFTLTGPTTAATTCTLAWLENQSTGHRLYLSLVVACGETVTIDLAQGRKRVTSDWRGILTDQPLSNSDFAAWHLLPGANTIAAYVTGTTTGVTLTAHWAPRHAAVDGPT